MSHALERLWSLLLDGSLTEAAALVDPTGAWDDPIHGAAAAEAIEAIAIPRLAAWCRGRSTGSAESIHPLRTTANDRRVTVETILDLKDGLVWNQAAQRAEKAQSFQLAVAAVGDRSPRSPESYSAIRVYFGTWSVLDGQPKMRVGPIAPDEQVAARGVIDSMPVIRRYMDCLAAGDAGIIELFEPDGYFREPANNYACGRDQLTAHFQHILTLGGVGLEFLTATREDQRIALELQTVLWGRKRMSCPQAGFASYELGPHGKIQGSRVYDSVVPPEFE
jgi:hypothetical protein